MEIRQFLAAPLQLWRAWFLTCDMGLCTPVSWVTAGLRSVEVGCLHPGEPEGMQGLTCRCRSS